MLPKSHRLNLSTFKPGEPFPGTKTHSPHLTIIYHPNTTHLRLGVVVSKKVSPKAVTRNLIKRRLVNAANKIIPTTTQQDIFIIPHPTITTLTYQQIHQQLSSLISKLV